MAGRAKKDAAAPLHRGPAVRLIAPDDLADRTLDGHFVVSADEELRRANEDLDARRLVALAARTGLVHAEQLAATTQDRAEEARRQYEDARLAARQAEVALRQQRRIAADANLELRRAHEWLARFEAGTA